VCFRKKCWLLFYSLSFFAFITLPQALLRCTGILLGQAAGRGGAAGVSASAVARAQAPAPAAAAAAAQLAFRGSLERALSKISGAAFGLGSVLSACARAKRPGRARGCGGAGPVSRKPEGAPAAPRDSLFGPRSAAAG